MSSCMRGRWPTRFLLAAFVSCTVAYATDPRPLDQWLELSTASSNRMTPKMKEQFAAHKEFLAREMKYAGNVGPVKGAWEPGNHGGSPNRGPVPNDFCEDAIELFCGDVVTQDNTSATTDPNEVVMSCRFGAPGRRARP